MRKQWTFIHLRISEAPARAAMFQGFERDIRFCELSIACVAGGDSTTFRPQRSSFIEKIQFKISLWKRTLFLASSPIATTLS